MLRCNRFLLGVFLICSFTKSQAQSPVPDSILVNATLENVIDYAIKHQPLIQQSYIDEAIADQYIKSKIADWYPQINFNYSVQHNTQVATSIIGGNPVKLGVDNTSTGQFALKQNIFNPDVLFVNRTKDTYRLQAQQRTASNKIDVAADVAKAFYTVLAAMVQIRISQGDIAREERSLQDAYNQYKSGVADKIDYKRTTIALNNTKATKATYEAHLKSSLTSLKSLMNYPENEELHIMYDSLQLIKAIELDTLQLANYTNRIEYQLLESQRKLLKSNVDYNKWAFIPSVSANAAYNLNYLNNQFSKLYNNNFPSSYVGLALSVPIFQGFKRTANVKQAELELKRTDWDIIDLKNSVNTEYARALAVYKSNYANYIALKENMDLAQEVYDVIQLQYRSGIKAYLEVVTSETDLQNARVNYINAVYLLLIAKVDVQKSLGQLSY